MNIMRGVLKNAANPYDKKAVEMVSKMDYSKRSRKKIDFPRIA